MAATKRSVSSSGAGSTLRRILLRRETRFRTGRAARPPGAIRGDGGGCIRERAEAWKQEGEYLKSIGIQALATETAEGTAEWLHRRIREDWGFPDPPTTTMQDRFTSRYHGKRYSSGLSEYGGPAGPVPTAAAVPKA
jgi:hypothetical protein